MSAWMMSAGLAFARAASQPIINGVRDFDDAAIWQMSAKTTNHHFILAFGPAPAPGWRRLSSALFASPGTGSPFAVAVSLEAQPLKEIAANRMANITRYFIRSEP